MKSLAGIYLLGVSPVVCFLEMLLVYASRLREYSETHWRSCKSSMKWLATSPSHRDKFTFTFTKIHTYSHIHISCIINVNADYVVSEYVRLTEGTIFIFPWYLPFHTLSSIDVHILRYPLELVLFKELGAMPKYRGTTSGVGVVHSCSFIQAPDNAMYFMSEQR